MIRRLWRWLFRRRVRALRGEDYPELVKIWDNEADSVFDDL